MRIGDETLAEVQARSPGLDMTPYSEGGYTSN
jgi:hypothetical protein